MNLLRSEYRKITGTRLVWGLLAAILALVVLALAFTLWGPQGPGMEVEGAPTSVRTSDDVLSLLGVTGVVGLFSLIFGVTFATSEYRHQTAATTFLAEPHRWRVAAAKSVAAATVAVAYTATAMAIAMAIIWIYTTTEGLSLPTDADVWTFVAMSMASAVVNAVLGVGVGSAIRSQVSAIVAVLVWLFVVESLLGGLLPSIARWTPFATGTAMTMPNGQMSIAVASAVAVGYAALAMGVGSWLTERRDVL